jgi:hypothetical protein
MSSIYHGYTVLPGFPRVSDAVLEDQLVENLIDYFNWILLQAGGFTNVKRPSFKSKFKPAIIAGVADNKVWEVKPSVGNPGTGNWVWESDISYTYQPINPVKVYINNTLSPLTGSEAAYVNYRDGQIVFASPRPSTDVIEVEYSFRRFNFYDSDHDWFQQVVFDPISDDFILNLFAKNRVYLPAIIIELVSGGKTFGFQLGDYTKVEQVPVLFHILADRDEDRNKILRLLKTIHSHTIILYDTNKVADANRFAINSDGSVNPDAYTYPDLLENYAWKRARVIDVAVQDNTPQLPLFRAMVKVTLEILMP